MRTFNPGMTDFGQVGPITVARWEQQYPINDGEMPFGAMWYTVPAGGSSVRDQHPEPELSIVMTGIAHVEASGEITEVGSGQAFLLNSEEAHIIHNRTADQPLMIFSAYWMPAETEVENERAETAGV